MAAGFDTGEPFCRSQTASSTITVKGNKTFTLKIRYPEWVAPGALRVAVNGKQVAASIGADRYVSVRRQWRDGDKVDIALPMKTRLEQMPDKSNYYAVLHGPVVLAAVMVVYLGVGPFLAMVRASSRCWFWSSPMAESPHKTDQVP